MWCGCSWSTCQWPLDPSGSNEVAAEDQCSLFARNRQDIWPMNPAWGIRLSVLLGTERP